jgi:hypothetical protein
MAAILAQDEEPGERGGAQRGRFAWRLSVIPCSNLAETSNHIIQKGRAFVHEQKLATEDWLCLPKTRSI